MDCCPYAIMPVRNTIHVVLGIMTLCMTRGYCGTTAEPYDFTEMIQPVPRHARLEHEDWYTWGASVLNGPDGQYHMFYCRWPKTLTFSDGWVQDAEICYAVAARPDGPFRHVRTVLRGRKYDGRLHAFDGASVYNPHVKAFNGKVYLYYTGNHDPSSDKMIGTRSVAVTHQAIGVLIADSLTDLAQGKFTRCDTPILKPQSRIRKDIPQDERFGDPNSVTAANIVVVNPSVERRPDGKYILMFKGWSAGEGTFGPVHGVAIGDTPVGPFEVQPEPVLAVPVGNGRYAMAEDPFMWYANRHGRFYALVKDFTGRITGAGKSLALFESPDAIEWRLSSNGLASKLQTSWEGGGIQKLQHLERAQLLFDESGEPIMLYAAAALNRNEHTFNVHIPLKGDATGAGESTARSPEQIPTPRPCQLAWQQAELGILVCYELHTFNPGRYRQGQARIKPIEDCNQFNPIRLDTDQWIRAAKSAGATFAILTASHESGFRLWQSDVNPYCLKAVQWGNGKHDLVGEFAASCRKYDVQPGIYLGTRWNAQLGVYDFKVTQRSTISQNEYNRMIEKEVEEICTRYGEWFEFWFDGGAHGPEQGGPDVLSIVEKYQPQAVFYHSLQRADARWGGSESGTVPYPCWATFPYRSTGAGETARREISKNGFALLKHGDPEGRYWMPAMSDAPLRGYGGHEWFWEPGDEGRVYPLDKLVDMYHRSVGHNSTLILGIAPDTDGLVPQADVKRLKEFGDAIRSIFSEPLDSTGGQGKRVELMFGEERTFDNVVIQEDIRHGERVREYNLEFMCDGDWQPLAKGTCIGHKRIHRLSLTKAQGVRLIVQSCIATPLIKKLAVYNSRQLERHAGI